MSRIQLAIPDGVRFGENGAGLTALPAQNQGAVRIYTNHQNNQI